MHADAHVQAYVPSTVSCSAGGTFQATDAAGALIPVADVTAAYPAPSALVSQGCTHTDSTGNTISTATDDPALEFYPLGSTSVQCRGAAENGDTSLCEFTVTVVGAL